MEVNFFGLVNVTRAGMKTMREQKPQGGVVQQITSIGGQTGVPLVSIYCASKVCPSRSRNWRVDYKLMACFSGL